MHVAGMASEKINLIHELKNSNRSANSTNAGRSEQNNTRCVGGKLETNFTT
jgi:hypothetical protein